jgi:hypothetical protein
MLRSIIYIKKIKSIYLHFLKVYIQSYSTLMTKLNSTRSKGSVVQS